MTPDVRATDERGRRRDKARGVAGRGGAGQADLLVADHDGGLEDEDEGLVQRVQQPVARLVRALDARGLHLGLEPVLARYNHLAVRERRKGGEEGRVRECA